MGVGSIQNILFVQPEFKFKYVDLPLGLLYLSTYLKQKGYAVKLYDDSLQELGTAELETPDLVGVYVTVLHDPLLPKYLEIIKHRWPHALVFLGGPQPSIEPEKYMAYDSVDGLIVGEAEVPFSQFIAAYNTGKSFSTIDGLYFKDGEQLIKNKKQSYCDLKDIPLPDYTLIDMHRYIKQWPYFDYVKGVIGASLITSRGCPFGCTYCQPIANTMFGLRNRRHPVADVIVKMNELHDTYGVNAFFFHDDTFILDRAWITEFCNQLMRQEQKYIWTCNTRLDTVSSDLLRLMKQAGCKEIRFGIESINPKALAFYNKQISKKQLDKAIRITKQAGINVFGFFMIGAPMETVADIERTISFAVHSDIDFVRFSILVNMPGTNMSKMSNRSDLSKDIHGEYDSSAGFDYIKDSQNYCSLIPYKKLVFMRRMAYLHFYFHPKRFVRSVLSLMNKTFFAKLERF